MFFPKPKCFHILKMDTDQEGNLITIKCHKCCVAHFAYYMILDNTDILTKHLVEK